VADEAALQLVALLHEDDVVDEPAAAGRPGRDPQQLDTGQLALQRLEQRHEVPHRVDVVLHEGDDRVVGTESGVERVADDPVPRRGDALLELFDSGVGVAPVVP
jgi:hypothetical protein